jgi:chitin disaccharide deacetylase
LKYLIVNADDFGLTEGVSRAILHAHAHGIVTSTTLLANGGAFQVAVDMARQATKLAIGAHLNLTQGTPVSPPEGIASLVDGQGKFRYTPGGLWKAILTRQIRRKEIETELRAQITKILDAGFRPTHLDGHMHIHVLPGVSTCVIDMAREFGVPAVRCPLERRVSHYPRKGNASAIWLRSAKRNAIVFAVAGLARRLKTKLGKAGLKFPAHFYGVAQTGFLSTEMLTGILKSLPDEISELCCHPGYCDAELAEAGGELTTQREIETQALTSSEIKSLIGPQAIRLVTYRELSGNPR